MTEQLIKPAYWLQYQKDWLVDKSRIKIWEKSRRIGATYIQSYEDVTDCITKQVSEVWFSSKDETSAKLYIQYCEKWAKIYNYVFKNSGKVIIDEKKGILAECLRFSNGTVIYALTSNPTQFRSKGGKIILDEFAWHDNPDELWRAAFPCITWGFPIRILSTHNGTDCLYYDFVDKCKNKEMNWSLHTTTLQDAIDVGLVDKILKHPATQEEKDEFKNFIHDNCFDEKTWLQEYCCEASTDQETKVIKNWSSDNIREVPYIPELDMHISCDFNMSPNCWILAHKNEDKAFFFDEFCLDEPTEEMIRIVLDKYPHPGRIIINGDASGSSGCSKSRFTDYKLINNELISRGYREESSEDIGGKTFRFDLMKSNGSRKARFSAFNRKVKNINGKISIYADPKCVYFDYNCRELRVKLGTSDYDLPTIIQMKKNRMKKYLGHGYDDGSYFINYYWPIDKHYSPPLFREKSLLEQWENNS